MSNKELLISRRTALAAAGMIPAGLSAAGTLKTSSSRAAADEGWQHLFNGRDLSGWHFFQDGVGDVDRGGAVRVRDSAIHLLGSDFRGPDAPGVGFLTTTERFSDFHLQLDYRWGERRFAPRLLHKRNSGLIYHLADLPERLWPDCVELQLQESDVADAILVNMTATQGASLGGTPAWPNQPEGAVIPRGAASRVDGVSRLWFRKDGNFEREHEWNRIDLIVVGDRAAHLVNGRIVNTLFGVRNAAGDAPGAGHIALELESAEIMFRRIAIRPIKGEVPG